MRMIDAVAVLQQRRRTLAGGVALRWL